MENDRIIKYIRNITAKYNNKLKDLPDKSILSDNGYWEKGYYEGVIHALESIEDIIEGENIYNNNPVSMGLPLRAIHEWILKHGSKILKDILAMDLPPLSADLLDGFEEEYKLWKEKENNNE